jgi:hypothetical protein
MLLRTGSIELVTNQSNIAPEFGASHQLLRHKSLIVKENMLLRTPHYDEERDPTVAPKSSACARGTHHCTTQSSYARLPTDKTLHLSAQFLAGRSVACQAQRTVSVGLLTTLGPNWGRVVCLNTETKGRRPTESAKIHQPQTHGLLARLNPGIGSPERNCVVRC